MTFEDKLAQYSAYINKTTQKFRKYHEWQELKHVATIGLYNGLRTYKKDKGKKESSYIMSYIDYELLKFINGWTRKTKNVIIYQDKNLDEIPSNNIHYIDKQYTSKLFGYLDRKEKNIVSQRYYGNRTVTEIAKKLGISHQRVSQIEKRALSKLKERIEYVKQRRIYKLY